MNKLADLRARAAQLMSEIDAITDKAIAEKRATTDDENKALETKRAELRPLAKTIRDREADEELRGSLTEPGTKPEGPAAGTDQPATIRPGADREAGKPFRSLGEQLRAVMVAEDRGRNEVDKRLLRLNAESRAASGLSEAVPHDGGFAVQTDFVQTMVGRIFDQETGFIASRVQRVEIGANANGIKQNVIAEASRATGSRWGGVQAYWTDEAAALTEKKPKLRQLQMDLEKLTALWYLTEELMQDSTAMASVAEQAFSEELQFVVEDSILNGTGNGRPLGILNSSALVSVAPHGSQTIANTATYIAENTAGMVARFNGSRARAVWLANVGLFPHLATAQLGTSGVPIYLNQSSLATAPFGTLWGIPIFFTEYNAVEGTVGDIMLVDLGWYLLISKGAPRFAQSMHVRFLNDEQAFKIVFRCNGQPIPDTSVTPYKSMGARSPFVALDTRT